MHTQDGQRHTVFCYHGSHLFRRPAGEPGEKFIPDENDTHVHPLSIDHLRTGEFEFTMPTEEEIKDKGEGNWLAKAFVLIQTTWFVVQCIARAIRHLPVTELEIGSLAYTTKSFGSLSTSVALFEFSR